MTPLAHRVLSFIETHGYITAERAWDFLRVPSGSLTRRVTEIVKAGYPVAKKLTTNPIDGRRYTRYSLETAA